MTRPLGLNENAWKNCKSYMMNGAFPTDPLEGDRIWRTDPPIGNRWFTYFTSDGVGYWQPDNITGRTTLAVDNAISGEVYVPFPVSFPFIPSVSLSFGSGGVPGRWILYAVNPATDGFTIRGANTTGGSATFSAFVYWMALPRS